MKSFFLFQKAPLHLASGASGNCKTTRTDSRYAIISGTIADPGNRTSRFACRDKIQTLTLAQGIQVAGGKSGTVSEAAWATTAEQNTIRTANPSQRR
jgi:hypothetical protein